MSRENVEVVVRMFENTNARDFAAVMEAYADGVVLVINGELQAVGGEGAVGKEAVGAWFGDWMRTFDRDYRFEIEETRDWGDRVLLVATHHGRGRGSGAPISQQGTWVYTLRDGKVVRCEVFSDRAAALAGAEPRP